MNTFPGRARLRRIPVGGGGVYLYREPAPEDANDDYTSADIIPWIGTDRCLTCVGVYFPFSATSQWSFGAHIFGTALNDRGYWNPCECTPAQGAHLKEMVLTRLQRLEATENWQLDRDYIRKHTVMVCPNQELPSTGAYVIEAIRAFVGEESLQATAETEGFYIDRRVGGTIQPVVCRHPSVMSLQECSAELARFDLVFEVDDLGWHFKVV